MVDLTALRRRTPTWVPVVAGLAFFVRLAAVLVQRRWHVFDIAYDSGDSHMYLDLARSLRSSLRYSYQGDSTAYVTPGYPIFLAVLGPIARSTLAIGAVQAAVGAVGATFLAATAGRIGGVRAAWATGLVAAVYPHFVFWSGYVLTETLFLTAISAGLYLLIRAAESPDRRTSFVAGGVWGFAALVRPEALLFAAAVVAVAVLPAATRRRAVLAGAGLLLVYGPWVARNAVTMHALVPTSSESGFVLWQGNSPDATGGTRGYYDGHDFKRLDLPDLPEIERDRRYMHAALDWMQHHPGAAVALAPKKLANLLRPTYAGASAKNTLITLVTYLPVLALGVVGLWLGRRSRGTQLVLAFLAYNLLVRAVVTGMIRFRIPIEACLAIGVGLAVAIWSTRATATVPRAPAPATPVGSSAGT